MYNMDIQKIKTDTSLIGRNIIYFENVDSTNNIAKKNSYENGTLIIAETQTKGKGRMGREWISEKNSGIYMSFVLIPKIPAERINILTLIAGLSVCEVLNEMYPVSFEIKWPNDIVTEGKKVCGILTEGVISQTESKAIVGIGINVNNKYFPDDLKEKATSLYLLTGRIFERENIIRKISDTFEKNYFDFINSKPLMEKYEKLCVNINREIVAIKDGMEIHATAIGITDTGELTVKKEDGTTLNINSGEVSVRGIYGYY